MTPLPDAVDAAIVGAGPAGMAAASVLARSGVSVAVFDEGPSPGGQIYRAMGDTPYADGAVLGASYWSGRKLVDEFRQSGAAYFDGSIVWSIQPAADAHAIAVSRHGTAHALSARRVIVATGALERPFPIPGWTLPGVLGAGAAQIALKASALVPQGRAILAGTGPLLYLLAEQYSAAGAPVALLLDMTPRANLRQALPALPPFLLSSYARPGLALRAAVRRSTRIESGISDLRAMGSQRLERIVWRDRAGRDHEMAIDWLLLHQGVAPNVNFARAIGCALDWDATQLSFRPRVDPWQESSVPGVFLAGDGAGIVGAVASAEQGRLAALQVAQQLGAIRDSVRDLAAVPSRRRLRSAVRGREFLDRYFQPAVQNRRPTGDTIVCRCEEITANQLNDAVAKGALGPNQAKAYLRCGMGPCQGRYCGLTVSEMIAAATAKSPQEIGYFRLRSPIKPVTLGEIASLPGSEAARRVVEPA
jgi:NADPH-dependent 2,4-dienoyl-CoA reductase/sulfur reductase-like enzyme